MKKATDKHSKKVITKSWRKPKATTLRLGFEVTAYAGIDPEPHPTVI